jgi:hypothetical protein
LNLLLKIQLLKNLYTAYDEVAKSFPWVCDIKCTACCTQNILGTSLEAGFVLERLCVMGRQDLLERFVQGTSEKWLQPILTINTLADFCIRRKEPHHQEEEMRFVSCPILENGCPVYDVRPFGCRALWSESLCRENGQASMNPALVAINGVFQQIVEHIDEGGLYGNMIDLLRALADNDCWMAHKEGRTLKAVGALLENRPNPGFLVPPEHRAEVMSALKLLWETRIDGIPFKEALALGRSPETG